MAVALVVGAAAIVAALARHTPKDGSCVVEVIVPEKSLEQSGGSRDARMEEGKRSTYKMNESPLMTMNTATRFHTVRSRLTFLAKTKVRMRGVSVRTARPWICMGAMRAENEGVMLGVRGKGRRKRLTVK